MTDQKNHEVVHGGSSPGMCDNRDLLLRYILRQTNEAENAQVYRHLNECPDCYGMVADTVLHEYRQPTPEEAAAVETFLRTPPEARVNGMIDLYRDLNPPAPGLFAQLLGRLKLLWDRFFLSSSRPVRWVFAVLMFLVSIVGAERLVFFYRTAYQIRLAEKALQEEIKIPFKDTPQLAGNYESTGKGTLMSRPEEARPLDVAKTRLQTALSHDPNSLEARRLLAQLYLTEGDFARAEQIYREAGPAAARSAPFLNDMGVLAFRQEKWGQAAHNFQKALTVDPNFPEAYYNLALTMEKMGDLIPALDNLNRYIELETNEGWKNAALSTKAEWERRLNQP